MSAQQGAAGATSAPRSPRNHSRNKKSSGTNDKRSAGRGADDSINARLNIDEERIEEHAAAINRDSGLSNELYYAFWRLELRDLSYNSEYKSLIKSLKTEVTHLDKEIVAKGKDAENRNGSANSREKARKQREKLVQIREIKAEKLEELVGESEEAIRRVTMNAARFRDDCQLFFTGSEEADERERRA